MPKLRKVKAVKIYTGHRADPELWAQAVLLAKQKGLASGNALLNRLLAFAVDREWIPEYIPDPKLPFSTPPREEERAIPKTHTLAD